MSQQRGPIASFGTPRRPGDAWKPRAEVVILKDEAGNEWAFREVEENRWERMVIVRPERKAEELHLEKE